MIVALLLLCSGIQAPDTVSPGDLVVLKTDQDAKTYEWRLVGSNKTYWVSPDSKAVLFGAGMANASYTFLLICVDTDGAVETFEHVLTVGPPPTPGPSPEPTPGPTPTPGPLPDGTFGAAKLAHSKALEIAGANKQSFQGLAAKLRAIKSSIDAGAIKSPQVAVNEFGTSMDSTIGPSSGPAGPWRLWVKEFIDTLIKGQRLRSVQDIGTLFDEIALGLEAVK